MNIKNFETKNIVIDSCDNCKKTFNIEKLNDDNLCEICSENVFTLFVNNFNFKRALFCCASFIPILIGTLFSIAVNGFRLGKEVAESFIDELGL